jgi:hypothetical protein
MPINRPASLTPHRPNATSTFLVSLTLALGCADRDEGARPITTPAAAATSETAAIRAAYRARSPEYTPRLRAKLTQIAALSPATCVSEQRSLLDLARLEGLDGLESLWLAYQDCAARTTAVEVRRAAQANARRLRSAVRYTEDVAYQLGQWTTSHHGLFAREVRGEALRAVMTRLAALEPLYVGLASGTSLLASAPARAATCAVAPRRNGAGTMARSELERLATCAIVDVEDRCAAARAGLTASFPGLSAGEIARLAELCGEASTGGSAGLGSVGLDALDGLATGGCLDGLEDGVAQPPGYDPAAMAELISACYGDGAAEGVNPLASGYGSTYYGTDELGLHGAGLYVWRIAEPGTVYSAVITPDRDFLPLPSVEPGQTTTVTNPDGTTTTITADSDGSTAIHHHGTVTNDDGSVTKVDEASEIAADGSITNHASQETINADGTSDKTWSVSTDDGKGHRTEDTTYQHFDADGNSLGSTRTVTETTTNDDGTTTTTTTTTLTDADGTVHTSVDTTTGDALEPGGDPTNPACRELTALGYLGRDGVSRIDLEALAAGGIVDPRTVYPVPGEVDPQAGDEACHGNYTQPGLACDLPILCLEGMNDDCTCATGVVTGMTLQSTNCLAMQCAPGEHAVGGGGQSCQCVSDEVQTAEDQPGPGGPGDGCALCR